MSIKEHRLFIYKSNSETIEATDSCLSFNFDAGSVTETGDLYADNPSKTLGIKLLNTNNKQYSPHYTKGKIKFVDTTMNLVSSTNIYNLPYETTLMIYDKTNKYHMLISQDKIRVNSYNGVETETINVRIAYLDINEFNPINYLVITTDNEEYFDIGSVGYFDFGNKNYYMSQYETIYELSPLLQERARVTLYEDTVDYTFQTYGFNGQGNNVLTIKDSRTVKDITGLFCKKFYGLKNYFDLGSADYFLLGQEKYFKIASEGYNYSNVNILSFEQVGNDINITLDRNLLEDETFYFTITYKEYTEFLKFDGYINGAIESDLETVSFNCVDRAYDLMSYKVSSTSFRGYDSIATSDNEYETVEESIQITLASNSCTTSYLNYLNLFALNDVVKIYNGQDYYECTISGITSSSMTLTSTSTIPNGTYTVYKVYNPSLALETFIQNCLNDIGMPYTLYLGTSLYEFAYLPKNDEMQYNDLWNFFQDILIKTGNILSFENINNNFELFYRKIPTTFGTSKYTISDRHILQGTTFSMTGENVRNSYYLKYSNYESGSYVDTELIVDDFTLSSYQGTILTERNLLATDESLVVNDIVRINNEYLEVRQVLSSGVYKLNKNASESGTFNLYLSGDSTNEYGLKRAYYELDSTSQIDTNAEATNFLNLVLAQTKYPISTYVVKLNGNDYDLYNYDTITVNSPRLSLFNETMFVQSVAYDNNGGQKTLTITLTKIMQTGKYKYKEMITERGLNSVVTTNKNTTNDVFPPPQKLVALDPAIDDLQDYNVYSYISWNDFIGRTVAQWEIQFSTDPTFTTYETKTTNTTSEAIQLKEQKLYYVKVRGVGKEQVKGKWATTTVDASKYLIENPIQNRTWYIRLFAGNDEVEYFSMFDNLGYTNQYIMDNIDTIEIVPNADKGIKTTNYVQWKKNKFTTYPNRIETGLEKGIIDRTNAAPNKNLYFNSVPNGYYKFEGDSVVEGGLYGSLNTKLFKNIKGVNGNVIFRPFTSIKTLENRDASFGDLREIGDFTIACYQSDNVGLDCQALDEYYSDINNARITYKNIRIELRNYTTGISLGFSANKLENCVVENFSSTNCYGYVQSAVAKGNKAINCTKGFWNCWSLSYNSTINCTTKYDTCYASKDTSVPIPAVGSDSSTYGWNI